MSDRPSPNRVPGAAAAPPVVLVEDVACSYGEYVAVDDVSFSFEAGRIHALLGTNGAGKITPLEGIQGFRRPTGARAEVVNVGGKRVALDMMRGFIGTRQLS